ncbi:MAG: penicillin-binding protein 1A [Armatimonadota bacterium]|nr:penicillin-binding protein 1A [Armatimonadota bacterium]MDR7442981.1 penicillin-binding protein 1A [Armatimonadota bacterium]MDR7569415.1 penicillin-binding protein 1A [Armatimonadota bacterium]MDR7614564.1 penicillin-binding protein 1A [Armatimonadota bacterium]
MKGHGRSSRRRPRGRARWVVVGSALLASLSVASLAGVAALLLAARASLPDVSVLYHPPSQATRIYAANGELIASLYRENRVYVPLSAIPRVLQQAVIAIEDERFYRHRGVDAIGVARALWVNLTRNRILEGGSTITQQLARTLFLTPERTLTRKLHEMLLALEMERHLTKDEILERYLNQVYFGNGAYGVEMAAQVYFNRRVGELGLPEASLLAGLIQAPSRYDPFRNFPAAKRRQEQVLRKMVEVGFLSEEQAQAALRAPLGLRRTPVNAGLVGIRAPYFVSYLLPFLLQRYGEERVYRGGLRVYTTLDVRLQELAQRIIAQGIAEARGSRVSQGALVALDPRTGHIKAMVGGVDFHRSQFNRAWQARRQPGSAFKPFIYVTALEHGASPEDILRDEPVRYRVPGFGEWQPKNYDRTYWGPLSLRRAVEHSRNVPAVRVLAELGPQAVIETARRMGIQSDLRPNLSLALGTSEVTVLEMASAYGTLAANGVHAQPMAIIRVTDAAGRVLDEFSPERRLALRPEVAYTMTDILRGVILRGTGRAADIGRPAAGKTGTTDDYRNAWFVGYTPDLVAAVWVGNDDNTPMRGVVGGTVPARLWARFMREALVNRPPVDFPRPEGVPAPGEPGPAGRTGPEEGSGHVVKLHAPAAGDSVSSPFEVAGKTTPGSRVRVVVTLEGGATPVLLRDEWLSAGPDGTFRLTVGSPLGFLGARYVITVTAWSPGGAQATAGVTVTER